MTIEGLIEIVEIVAGVGIGVIGGAALFLVIFLLGADAFKGGFNYPAHN